MTTDTTSQPSGQGPLRRLVGSAIGLLQTRLELVGIEREVGRKFGKWLDGLPIRNGDMVKPGIALDQCPQASRPDRQPDGPSSLTSSLTSSPSSLPWVTSLFGRWGAPPRIQPTQEGGRVDGGKHPPAGRWGGRPLYPVRWRTSKPIRR